MYRGVTVAVVVPAYNEAEHVGEVIETLPAFVDRVYAVDDGSGDGTWSVLCEYADVRLADGTTASETTASETAASGIDDRQADGRPEGGIRVPETDASRTRGPEDAETAGDPPWESGDPSGSTDPVVVAVRHGENRGVGASIKTGYRRALADGVDVTAVIAGDGQMDPEYLDEIVAPVVEDRADYAKGTRLSRPDHVASMSRWRRFGNWLLTHLTRISTGYWDLEDPQDGYTAISRRALSRIRIDDLYDRYGFANDLLAALGRVDARVVDVPHPAQYGAEGSEIRYRTFVPGLSSLLLANFLRRIRHTAATRPFDPAVVGYLLAGTGLAGATVAAVLVFVGAAGLVRSPPVWTAPAALLAGVAFAVAAFVADVRRGRPTATPSRGSTDVGEGGGRA